MTYWGYKGGYFKSEEDASAFRDELAYMLAPSASRRTRRNVQHRPALGLWHRWPEPGHYYVDPFTGKLTKSKSSYEHPQPHACFIQACRTTSQRGRHHDLWCVKARLFKYGSGTGSNFLAAARRRRKAVGRRPLVRPDDFSRSATARRAPSSR